MVFQISHHSEEESLRADGEFVVLYINNDDREAEAESVEDGLFYCLLTNAIA